MAIKASQIRELRNTGEWAKQIWYWRTHLDVFIEQYFNVRLKTVQKIEARAFGNCQTLYFVQSRGFGKTWLTALCCLAMGVLYPGSLIAVVSGTAEQATLVLKKIDDEFIRNENIIREIDTEGHAAVRISRAKGKCSLRNGSVIESFSMGTFRGNRAKIIVIDEAPEVKQIDLEAVVRPVRNTTRSQCIQLGFEDYPSKLVSITSACLKSNYFFDAYKVTLKDMAMGDTTKFACALDFNEAARAGISKMSFFEEERRSLSREKFAMEYGSYFIGAESDTCFPYDLTESCRTLREVEVAQPVKSKSEYVMGIDIATSSAKSADNTAICILKLADCEDGSYIRKLVYLRTYHGTKLDILAKEVRSLLIKFPNVKKIIFDHNGLGDAFPQFFSEPWTDPESQKEYPPLVMDTERSAIHDALPLLRPFKANAVLNQQLVSALTVSLQRKAIQLPVSSRTIIGTHFAVRDEAEESSAETNKKLTKAERAIFLETDALQVEMGNVVGRQSSSGAITYDTAKPTQHKDRYSALAMANWYVSELEKDRKKRIGHSKSGSSRCVVFHFNNNR